MFFTRHYMSRITRSTFIFAVNVFLLNVVIFSMVTPCCGLVGGYQQFSWAYCLYREGQIVQNWRWKQYIPSKHWYPTTKLKLWCRNKEDHNMNPHGSRYVESYTYSLISSFINVHTILGSIYKHKDADCWMAFCTVCFSICTLMWAYSLTHLLKSIWLYVSSEILKSVAIKCLIFCAVTSYSSVEIHWSFLGTCF